MSGAVLRSIAAVLLGWLVTVGGCWVTMVVIALFDPEGFQPGVRHSVGYWLLTLSVGLIYSVVGGFVTGIIARRREIAHAIGLVVFGLLISECLSRGHANTMSAPSWYWIAGYILMPSATILGGWLRAKQDTVAKRMPGRVSTAIDNMWLSIAITIDHSRPLIAALVACVVFAIVLFGGAALGVGGLLVILQKVFGEDYHPPIALPVFVACIILASIVSRRVFRRIMPRDTSLLEGGRRK